MARLTLSAIVLAALGAADTQAQFDTTLTVICEGCPFTELLLEWDTSPGADELVQLGDSLFVRSNNGSGGFGPPQFVTALPAGEQLVLFEDVDDDGDQDLFTHLNGTVHLLRNEVISITTVLLDTVLDFDSYWNHPAAYGTVRSMQVDNDGLKDLSLRWNNGNTFTWYRNDGLGGYVKRIDTLSVNVMPDGEIVAMDWNNDGENDLITTTDSGVDGVVIIANNGIWNTLPDTICTSLSSFGMRFWDVVDMNIDGVPDVLNPLNMFLSDPDSLFYLRHVVTELNYNDYRRIMDLDCDGRPELFGKAINLGNADFHVVQLEGDSLVIHRWNEIDPYIISNMLHVVADLNADGAADLLFKPLPFPEASVYARYNLATPPDVSLNLPFTSLAYGSSTLLSGGTPEGGTWSGDGVVGDTLFTALAPGGSILITYSFANEFGCANSAQALVDITTGLSDGWPPAMLLPHPQPADAQARIPSLHPDATIHLYDINGRLVVPEVKRHGDLFQINTDQLPAGIYVFSLIAHGRSIGRGRLMVAH